MPTPGGKEATEAPSDRLSGEISVRPLVETDLSTVLLIAQHSFAFPWSRASFLHELYNPCGRLLGAEWRGQVIGYLCFWLVADELHILNIATHPNHRRRGIGKLLLQAALADARQRGVRSASLEVRSSNLPAILLYQSLGFREVTVRRQYYENGEDALLMVCVLEKGKDELR
jgi:ribosomal-protein-alanine N-acetyltransferase